MNTRRQYSKPILVCLGFLTFSLAVTPSTHSSPRVLLERRLPSYILVEEHHHVGPFLLDLAIQRRRRGSDESGPLTLLHLDSHHDLGLPEYLPPLDLNHIQDDDETSTERTIEILEHTEINDFLLALCYHNAVEHVIFVEPPWSKQCESLHNYTMLVYITKNEVRGGKLMSYVEHEVSDDGDHRDEDNNEDSDSSDDNRRRRRLRAVYSVHGFFLPEQVIHVRPTDSELETNFRRIRLSFVALEDAALMVPRWLPTNMSDVVLDIDLDGFSTTSPGALALQASSVIGGVDSEYDDDLARIYHTVHDLCDYEEAYWRIAAAELYHGRDSRHNLKHAQCIKARQIPISGWSSGAAKSGEDASVEQWQHDRGDSDEVEEETERMRIVEAVAEQAVSHAARFHWAKKRHVALREAVASILDKHWDTIHSFIADDWMMEEEEEMEHLEIDQSRLRLLLHVVESFVVQPYFVEENESVVDAVVGYYEALLRTIFDSKRPPAAVTIVRSPFYCPESHLPRVEQRVSEILAKMFGPGDGVRTAAEVDLNRTGCANVHPWTVLGEEWTISHVGRSSIHDDNDDDPVAVVAGVTESRRLHHLDPMLWSKHGDVHDMFFAHMLEEFKMEEEDREQGDDAAGVGDTLTNDIVVGFWNEHENNIDLYWNEKKIDVIHPGETLHFKTYSGSQWSFQRSQSARIDDRPNPEVSEGHGGINLVVAVVPIDRANGLQQVVGTKSGIIPLTGATPVKLHVSHDLAHLEKEEHRLEEESEQEHKTDGAADDEQLFSHDDLELYADGEFVVSIPNGESMLVETYHGHRFTIHQRRRPWQPQNNVVGRVDDKVKKVHDFEIDASAGRVQKISTSNGCKISYAVEL